MFKRLPAALFSLCLGVGLLGVLCSALPVLSDAEESLGLHWLYFFRGVEKPLADVVVVAIDKESARALNYPAKPHKWSRTMHARLLDQLTAHGAAVVAFDLIFLESKQPSQDQLFAAAIKRAGNVILTQSIEQRTEPIVSRHGSLDTELRIEQTVSSTPLIGDAALAQAPFPLPKVPIKLNQYWSFSTASGDVPTLPIVVMHAFAMDAFAPFVGLIKHVDPSAASELPDLEGEQNTPKRIMPFIRSLYRLFEKDPSLAGRMLSELNQRPLQGVNTQTEKHVRALIDLYGSGNSRYLNFYGPVGTIPTISYYKVLALKDAGSDGHGEELPSLKGKAVFVGQTQSDWYKANDGFYTAFTESGMDISGVEIAATAFANILEGKAVYPLTPLATCSIVFCWGIVGVLISTHFTTLTSVSGLLLVNGIYSGMAYVQFKSGGIWYPLVVPLLVQTPVALIAGLIWKYRKANIERRNIREAFGYYLPDEVVSRLASNLKHLHTGGQVLYGICLFTDAESYTTHSEKMDPQSLTDLMNDYYEAIFKPIKENDGLILQVVGDSVLAIWSAPQASRELKSAACRAAVGINNAVQAFNAKAGRYPLPTRVGLHAGEILLGNIGAIDHFEYRPVGDIVNTASRLEGLNKFLGTRTLVSDEVVNHGNGPLTRSVGKFVFKGKSHAVSVHEILPQDKLSHEEQSAVCRIFTSGLEAFGKQKWDEASKLFNQVLKLESSDGPSQFYGKLCVQYKDTPPDHHWDGAVHLQKK